MSGVFSEGSELAGEEGTLKGRRLGAGGHLPEGELELSEAWKRKWEWTSRGQSSGRTRPRLGGWAGTAPQPPPPGGCQSLVLPLRRGETLSLETCDHQLAPVRLASQIHTT